MKNRWVIALLLVFTSCSGYNDNPVKPVQNQDRQYLEAAISKALDETSKDVCLDVGKDVLKNLSTIVASLDAVVLKELKLAVIQTVLSNADVVFFGNMSEEEIAVIQKCLADRFGMTEEEFNEDVKALGFMRVDAYKVFGHLKVTFQDGNVTLGESDDFTVESIDKDGHSTSLTMKLSDGNDGVRIFVDRVSDITPICVQFPKQIEVLLKMADGKELNGTLSMSSTSPYQYISFKIDDWHAAVSLASNFDGHHDNYVLSLDHDIYDALNVGARMIFDGAEKFNVTVKSAHDFKINVSKLNDFNNLSTFADFLAVFDGGVVDELQAVLNNEIVARGKVKDVTACMNALREIHNLAGSNPDFYTVDTYTQQLNDYLDFSISQKGHATKARSSLITCKADGEYLPHIALQFPNESAPMAIYDRFSKKDKQNYRHFADQVNALGKEARNLIGVVRNKIQVVKDLE